MGLIIVTSDGLCACTQATKCVTTHKSGCMSRCTKEEIEDSGYKTIQVFDKMDDQNLMKFQTIDGNTKKIKIELVRNDKPKKKNWFDIFNFK